MADKGTMEAVKEVLDQTAVRQQLGLSGPSGSIAYQVLKNALVAIRREVSAWEVNNQPKVEPAFEPEKAPGLEPASKMVTEEASVEEFKENTSKKSKKSAH